MGHYLVTSNGEAAERLAHPIPLPDIGAIVLYSPRPSEMRARRPRMPAIVTGRDEANELLNILVFQGVDDFIEIENLPRRMGEDRGWEPTESGNADEVAARLQRFMDEMAEALFGANEKPAVSVLAMVGALNKQIEDLQNRLATVEKLAKAPLMVAPDNLSEDDTRPGHIVEQPRRRPGRPRTKTAAAG